MRVESRSGSVAVEDFMETASFLTIGASKGLTHTWTGWQAELTASGFNLLAQHTSSPGNSTYCYAELTVFFPGDGWKTLSVLISVYPCRDGQAELTGVTGYTEINLHNCESTCPSTYWAWHKTIMLIETYAFPLSQTATLCRHRSYVVNHRHANSHNN